MDIAQRLTRFVNDIFKTTLDVFLEALRLSPNAQGYVGGSITELLLKRILEGHDLEVMRIREKWEGKKHPNHHGDLYFRSPPDGPWYVLESKGVKSNSERWHKLYNSTNLERFLVSRFDRIPWIDSAHPPEPQVREWIARNLPKMLTEYSQSLYDYEQVKDYLAHRPKKQTPKSKAIDALAPLSRDVISARIEERLSYVKSKVKVIETHLVSGTSVASKRTQATPRKDEFNLLAVDLVLRWPEHRFLFTNPKHLEPSRGAPNHLQQNYVIGFTFAGDSGEPLLSYTEEWSERLSDALATLNPADAISEADMQVDTRRGIDKVEGPEI